ncbi:MAG: hypothetical protein ACLT76_02765 [Clostridium fessum]
MRWRSELPRRLNAPVTQGASRWSASTELTQGIEELKSGKLHGTVQCDSDEYAEVIFEIAAAEALGQNVQEKVELEEGTYYQCSQKALTVADLP